VQKRSELVQKIRGENTVEDQKKLKRLAVQNNLVHMQISQAVTQQESRVVEFARSFELVKEATGITDPNVMYQKFMNKVSIFCTANANGSLIMILHRIPF
jgi:hypothetical protein